MMSKIKNWFLHLYRQLTEPSGEGRMLFAQPQRYRVMYKKDEFSIPLAYDVAQECASIFGGEVIKVDDPRFLEWEKKRNEPAQQV